MGRRGPRRWLVLVVVGGCLLLYGSLGGAKEDGTGGGASSWIFRGKVQESAYPVPVVDRTSMEKLRLLEIHYGADSEDSEETRMTGSRYYRLDGKGGDDAPPVVASIPDVVKPNPAAPLPLPKLPADLLDADTCPTRNGGPCAFLIPAWLGEQETKAQLHLYQLGLLALSLNRTLVLPNVAKSRLGVCYASPFSFYYDPYSLEALGIPTISQADFLTWAEQRDPPASAQVVSLIGVKAAYPRGAIEIDSASDPTLVPNKPSRNLCLKPPRTRLDFTRHSPLAIYPPEGFHKSESGRTGFGESVVNTLRSEEVGSKSSRESSSLSAPYSLPNVLAFNYELRYAMMSPAVVSRFLPSLLPPLHFSHFPYASTWTDIATDISTSLSPFVGIHWRTETLSPANLAPCASSLIRKLIKIKQMYPEITNVYLATDYPIEDLEPGAAGNSVAHSGTFAKVITEQHHTAMRAFLKEFAKKATGMRLTSFAKEQGSLVLPSELGIDEGGLGDLDPGLVGIVDKAVVMRSEIFLTGVTGNVKEGACAKISSFSNQIIEARERAVKEREGLEGETEEARRKGEMWNGVSRWSVKGADDD